MAGRGALRARPDFLWADFLIERDARVCLSKLEKHGLQGGVVQVSGRTLQEQVWWRRWVVFAARKGRVDPPCLDASEEPLTEVPSKFKCEWFSEERIGPAEEGRLQMDPAMPYLGATSPKPCGFIKSETGSRKLVWAPDRALPALHAGSWDEKHENPLLLLLCGKEGPKAHVMTQEQARSLLSGRGKRAEETPEALLAAAPCAMAELAADWAARETESCAAPGRAVGVCQLPWEEEAEATLMRWLEENPPRVGGLDHRVVGGKRRKRTEAEDISKALFRLLRHEAGTNDLPMTLEGWVKWEYLIEHPRLNRHDPDVIWDCIENNDKQRFVARSDNEGTWWVAAWSGHTIADCVGPSRSVPDNEVPGTLVHGTYHQYVPSIESS